VISNIGEAPLAAERQDVSRAREAVRFSATKGQSNMAAMHWTDDDAGYEQWIATHQEGFVANAKKAPTARYFRIHRASHSLPDRSNPGSFNPRTGRQYSKVTADSIAELNAWAEQNLPGSGAIGTASYCKSCLPTDNSPIESGPTTDLDEYVLRADRLRARGPVLKPVGVAKPVSVQCSTTVFYRDPKVRAWILQRAAGRCELCRAPAPFDTSNEDPYLESHHLVTLSEGGSDTTDNTAALCPNCHRELHYGINRLERLDILARRIAGGKETSARREGDG
jgi:HNH endonuclease